ncbi:MAG: Ig-like domain-containing protein [Halioglobus sp.]|nr:Ig-like domain-containing protein [Halioglobus sp.]
MKLLSVTLALSAGVSLFPVESRAQLDENCVISILNRTIQVSPGGGWSVPNVPANQGAVRARATCVDENGLTTSGQSDYFNIIANSVTRVGAIIFQNLDPIPTNLAFTPSGSIVLETIGATFQSNVTATYADGSTRDVSAASTGTNYSTTNANVARVSPQGLVTAVGNGLALITARKDGVLAARTVQVVSGGDLDGDGLPDDYELRNGLNPNDPIDALEDQDGDGLSALQEFNAGTNPRVADTDGDGIRDGEELVAGVDGFITNPLLADSDGDGLSDGVEVAVGSDPNDETDRNIAAALVSLRSTPANVVMTFNGIDSEVSAQLTINGVLIDGSLIDLTNAAATSYSSSDLTVVSFGANKGEIFGGEAGNATVTVSSNGKSVVVNVTVRAFEASALSAIDIPGYANNVDISGDYAFIAAGAAGLQVVDVSDRTAPEVVAELDTDGTAIDIKVIGDIAYVADGDAGLKVIDISDPLAPALIGQADTAGIAQDLFVQLSYVYVANGDAGIEIFDISEPTSPFSVATLGNLGTATGIAVEQDLAVVTAGTALIAISVSDPASPMRLGSINIGSVKDVALENGYAHVAAYSQGYRVVDMSNPMLPRITGGDSSIAPRDVALTRNFAFYAEQLFPNVVAFINIFDPENPIFQGTINLSPFGDYAGTGIALDASYAYITEESFVVSTDYNATGNTRLFIAQYRDLNDNNGVPPTVSISSPADGSVVVEGRKLVITADAQDDVVVASVGFYVNGVLAFTDTSSPYQVSITVPAADGSPLVLEARAADLGGNTASSGNINLEIQPDADGDGLGDDEEVDTWNTDPQDPDSDDDGLSDGEEIRLGTNPNDTDSDGDGIDDKTEVDNGTDPLNPDITPPALASIDPADGATEIPENSSIAVMFDEPLLPKSIKSSVLRVIPEGSTTPIPGSLQLTSGNTGLLFVPTDLMQDFKLHTVMISGVKDTAGNPIVPVERSFTTGNFIDTVRPTIVDVSPANSETDVALNSLIDVILSEPIIPNTVTSDTFYVLDKLTGLRLEGTTKVSNSKTRISFVLNTQFLVGRQ